ncbi:MAG: 6-phosphogluconolactonase [Gammaproteobacteria bacterium]
MTQPPIHICPNPAAIAEAVARCWAALSATAIAERGLFHVALAGGSTPRLLYQTLASPAWRDDIDWSRIHVFFGDERSVPPDHPDSNFRMARESLLDHVPIPTDQIHRMKGEQHPLETAAAAYADCLEMLLPRSKQGAPCFDLILLGLGTDGHIASLFPGTAILHERERWVAPVYVDKLHTWRLSLTFPVLNQARHVLLLVAGDTKRPIVKAVLAGEGGEPRYPVQMIQPQGELAWYLDEAAAPDLPPSIRP